MEKGTPLRAREIGSAVRRQYLGDRIGSACFDAVASASCRLERKGRSVFWIAERIRGTAVRSPSVYVRL